MYSKHKLGGRNKDMERNKRDKGEEVSDWSESSSLSVIERMMEEEEEEEEEYS